MQVLSPRLACLALPLLLAGAAKAQTGLANMPIADILKHRECLFESSVAGAEHARQYGYCSSLSMGLFDRIEFGGEANYMGTYLGKAKLQLFENKNSAFSVGFKGLRGKEVDPYVVGRLDGKGYRLHGGLWRTGGCVRPMVGLDYSVAPGWVGSTEYLGGPEGQSWTSFSYSPSALPGFCVTFAAGLGHGPLGRSVGIMNFVNLAYGFKI